jgi:hypothetical protein
MTLPLDVPSVTLTYGAHINAGKEPLKSGTLIVVPQLARTHLASGTYVDRSAVKTDLAGGVATSEPVVASDATGFNVDGLTLYTIRFEGLIAADGSLLDRPALINVALPAAIPVVDVDMLASGESQSGAIINYPSVIDIAGLSGSVSADDLFAAIESSVTAKVETGNVFRARNARDAGIDATGQSDVTEALNAYLQDAKTHQREAYLPRGAYLARQIVYPTGLKLSGAGVGGFGGSTVSGASGLTDPDLGTGLIQKQGEIQDFVVFEMHGAGGNEIGPFHIEHLAIVGQGMNTYAHGMATHSKGASTDSGDNDTAAVNGRLQDTCTIANVLFTRWRRSGLSIGLGARPFHIRDCNFLWNGDFGIDFNGAGILTQAVHFDNISGDGNRLGLVRLKALDRQGASVTFTSVKSEKRLNEIFSNEIGQNDCLIFEDCDDVPVQIQGLTHASSVPSGGFNEPPGAAIVVKGIGKPQITYAGVRTRVRGTDVAGAPAVLRDDALTLGDGVTKYSVHASATGGVTEGIYGGTDGSYSWSQTVVNARPQFALASGESVFNRDLMSNSGPQNLTSGELRLSFFKSDKTEAISKVRFLPGSTAAGATPTLARVGIYEVNADGSVTLIRSSTNDTSKFSALTTAAYTVPLSSTFMKIRGKRYVEGVLVVTPATAPSALGISAPDAVAESIPMMCASLGGQTDLPSTISLATLLGTGSSVRIYSELLP